MANHQTLEQWVAERKPTLNAEGRRDFCNAVRDKFAECDEMCAADVLATEFTTLTFDEADELVLILLDE